MNKDFVNLLSEVLSDKLGSSKYKQYLPLDNLKSVVLEYISKQMKEKNIKLSGAAIAKYNSMVKKCKKANEPLEFISAISETMLSLQGF